MIRSVLRSFQDDPSEIFKTAVTIRQITRPLLNDDPSKSCPSLCVNENANNNNNIIIIIVVDFTPYIISLNVKVGRLPEYRL